MKQIILNVLCGLVALAIIFTTIWGLASRRKDDSSVAPVVSEQLDASDIELLGNHVEVNFSEVLLSDQREMRKLIVCQQTGTVNVEVTKKLLGIDADIFEKSQSLGYTAEGYFVVDLSKLNKSCIIDDKTNHVLSIKVERPYLEAIEIDPNNIVIGETKQGLLNYGDIKMTLKQLNEIETLLQTRLQEKFNTASNIRLADANAKSMVKEIYEPIVQAIDKRYTVEVEFVK